MTVFEPGSRIRRAALLLTLAALPARAKAAEAPARAHDKDARRAAQEHLDRGNELFTGDHFPEALAEFEAAFALFPSPKLHFNLGQCERALGHDDAAALHFQRFLDDAANVSPALRAEAERYLAELRARAAEAQAREAEPKIAAVLPAPPPPLAATIAPPTMTPPPAPFIGATRSTKAAPPPRSFVTRWWFWTAVGVVAVGAAASIFLLTRPRDPACNDKVCL